MGLGEKLRARREGLGLEQLEIAQRVGVVPSCVSEWESGRMRPKRHRLPALAKALRVSASRLTQWWMAA